MLYHEPDKYNYYSIKGPRFITYKNGQKEFLYYINNIYYDNFISYIKAVIEYKRKYNL